jgi:hypothetical protein
MLIARTAQTNPVIPTATRNQSYRTHSLTNSAISAGSCRASGAALATAQSAAFAGQNQRIVKRSVTSSMIAGTPRRIRNRHGVLHPAIKPPNEHTNKATELGKK